MADSYNRMKLLRARVLALGRTSDASMYAGKDFRDDWVGSHTLIWRKLFEDIRDKTSRVLEIGSLEGRSAVFWLEFFAGAHLTCIDIFKGDYSERFDRNLAGYGPRVRKLVGTSIKSLGILREEKAVFDLIYVDGSHRRDDVMIDCLGAWRMLRDGGVMLMDDYYWKPERADAERAETAIDTFIAWHPEAEVIHNDYQVAVRKRSA